MKDKHIIVLDKDDFELCYVRKHPVQLKLIREYGVAIEDVFGVPQPYMGLLDWAKLDYNKGVGKYGKGYAEGWSDVSPEKSWFWTHFVGDPVMAGTQGTDGYLQLGFVWGCFKGDIIGRCRALSGSFTFNGQVFPTAKRIYYRVDIKRFLKKQKIIFFEGSLSVDDPENIIYTFGETKGGWFSGEKLKVPESNVLEYYNPDWEKCRNEMLECIDRVEEYYKKLKK